MIIAYILVKFQFVVLSQLLSDMGLAHNLPDDYYSQSELKLVELHF